jgi:hypothetical protein
MDKRVLIITMSFLACGMLPRVFAQTTPPIPTATAPDNSGINTRDRASNAMTAGEPETTSLLLVLSYPF